MASDEDLLLSDFGGFYDRHADVVLDGFARRVRDPEAAAELTAETFAAALLARRRFPRAKTTADAWLSGIAERQLADYRRYGMADDRMRRRLRIGGAELRDDLVAAAERERARRLPRVELPVRAVLLAAAAAAAVVLVVVVAAGSLNAPEEGAPVAERPTPAAVRDLFGGELTPDVRYQTRELVPTISFVVADGEWHTSDTEQPDALVLEHGDPFFEPGGERRPAGSLSFGRIIEVYDPATGALTTAPADLYGWLRDHPDLRVGRARPVTVAHVPGLRFAVAVAFRRPAHPDPDCRRRFQVTCTAISPRGSYQDGTLLQVTILQTEPDPLIVTIAHFTRAGLRRMEEAAAPVLESLRIG